MHRYNHTVKHSYYHCVDENVAAVTASCRQSYIADVEISVELKAADSEGSELSHYCDLQADMTDSLMRLCLFTVLLCYSSDMDRGQAQRTLSPCTAISSAMRLGSSQHGWGYVEQNFKSKSLHRLGRSVLTFEHFLMGKKSPSRISWQISWSAHNNLRREVNCSEHPASKLKLSLPMSLIMGEMTDA